LNGNTSKSCLVKSHNIANLHVLTPYIFLWTHTHTVTVLLPLAVRIGDIWHTNRYYVEVWTGQIKPTQWWSPHQTAEAVICQKHFQSICRNRQSWGRSHQWHMEWKGCC
jgi:hypothetical protein